MYIIETHCSLNSDGTIADHESRIIKNMMGRSADIILRQSMDMF